MANPQPRTLFFSSKLPARTIASVSLTMLAIVLATALGAHAQTLTVLHSLTSSEGIGTIYGLVADRAGNLYGSAYSGGISNCPYDDPGCGTVFKVSRHGSPWIFTVLYRFTGVSDGWWPQNLAVGPDGSIYGTTSLGGLSSGCLGNGCGTVFRLQPPPNFCPTVSCPWRKTTLYEFSSGLDGRYPSGPTVDAAGNVYGTTNEAGENGSGNIWELSPSNGSWSFQVLYQFNSIGEGSNPLNGVGLDDSGNLWGSGDGGNSDCGGTQRYQCGAIWELMHSGSGWSFDLVYNLDGSIGGAPLGTFTFDSAGNMYGTLSGSGPAGNGGVFQYVPATGQIKLLYAAPGNVEVNNGPQGGVTIAANGDLYAADPSNGAYDFGYVFQLTPSNGAWTYRDLHDFNEGLPSPVGPLVVDTLGNIYGTAANAVWEITP